MVSRDVWRVSVAETCIGSGGCQGVAPAHFVRGDDGNSRVLATEIEPDQAVLDAAASCPMEAITVYDANTGEPIEP
jgi:ferredoxin